MKRAHFLHGLLFLLLLLPSCNSIMPSSSPSSTYEDDTSFESEHLSDVGSDSGCDGVLMVTGNQLPVASMKVNQMLKSCHFQDISSQIDNDGVGLGDVYTKELHFYLDGSVSVVNEQMTDSSGLQVNHVKDSVFENGDQFYSVLEANDSTETKILDQQGYENKSFDFFSNAQYLYQGQLGSVYTLADYHDTSFNGFYFQDEFCYGSHQSFSKNQNLFLYHFDGVNTNGSKMIFDLMFSFIQVKETYYLDYYFASEAFTGEKWIEDRRSTETIYEYGERENGTDYPDVSAEAKIN